MSIYYPASCADEAPLYNCDPCPISPEHGRVRSTAYIHKSWVFSDPTNAVEWLDGIDQGKIIIVPETNGEFDGGSPVMGPGYGDVLEVLLGYNFSLKYKDPRFAKNVSFYNQLKNSRNYKFAYRTETKTWITVVPVQIIPKQPVGGDLTSVIDGDIEVKFSHEDLVLPYDTPEGVFDCFTTA